MVGNRHGIVKVAARSPCQTRGWMVGRGSAWTRERIRQIEGAALLRARLEARGLSPSEP